MHTTALKTWLLLVGTSSLMTLGCATIKDANIRQQVTGSSCNQQNVYSYSEDDLPQPLHAVSIDPALANHLNSGNLHIANALGLLPDLAQYITLKKDIQPSDLERRLTVLELKQRVDHKINIASLEVSAVASEMDCEEERTSQVANYLKGSESETESKLTIAAIVVGAAGAIATGGLIESDAASNTVGIATGITEASLGLLMLFNNRKIVFYHKRNALREVWEWKPVSSNFPPFVWYYLTYRDPNKGTPSIRETIVEKWKNFGQISDSVYFGDGGKYTTDQLVNRADMYDQLESHITLMKQDLKALSLAVDRL